MFSPYPVDNRIVHAVLNPKSDQRRSRGRYVYLPGGSPVPEAVAAPVRNRSHTILAEGGVPDEGAVGGALLAFGSTLGGFSFLVSEGRLLYLHNLYGRDPTRSHRQPQCPRDATNSNSATSQRATEERERFWSTRTSWELAP